MSDNLKDPTVQLDDARLSALADKLAEFSAVLAAHGPDAPQVDQFLQDHKDDTLFLEFAEESRSLEREVGRPRGALSPEPQPARGGGAFLGPALAAGLLLAVGVSLFLSLRAVGEKTNDAAQARQASEEKNVTISDLQAQVDRKDELLKRVGSPEELAQLTQRLKDQEARINDLADQLETRRQAVVRLEKELQEKDRTLAANRSHMQRLDVKLRDSRIADCMALDLLSRGKVALTAEESKAFDQQLIKAFGEDLGSLRNWALDQDWNGPFFARRGAVLMLGHFSHSADRETAARAHELLDKIKDETSEFIIRNLSADVLKGKLRPF